MFDLEDLIKYIMIALGISSAITLALYVYEYVSDRNQPDKVVEKSITDKIVQEVSDTHKQINTAKANTIDLCERVKDKFRVDFVYCNHAYDKAENVLTFNAEIRVHKYGSVYDHVKYDIESFTEKTSGGKIEYKTSYTVKHSSGDN